MHFLFQTPLLWEGAGAPGRWRHLHLPGEDWDRQPEKQRQARHQGQDCGRKQDVRLLNVP